ncbi:MAG: GGDEF domain-containing protein [Dehalococcoidia bacterium]|nr:GGDEF domain-containing protein [Dehalococcoidia bacterium]
MEARSKNLVIGLAPVFAGGVIAVAATTRAGGFMLQLPLQAVVVAAVLTMAWRVAATIERARADVAIAAVKPVVLQRMTGDRRRPTFDRETGLLADWYFRLRVEEEIARAQRYGQKFTMLRIAHAGADARGGIARSARTCLRAIDLAGSVGSMTCVLLPNTSRDAASTVADRLLELVPGARIDAAECPSEASTLAGLLGETEWTTSEQSAAEDEAA